MDLSHLDKKYFIDTVIFNCPFCRRNNVPYSLSRSLDFDWSESKKCYVYIVTCHSCGKTSLHFSFIDLRIWKKSSSYGNPYPTDEFDPKYDLDNKMFFSHPTSYFTLDSRISENIRKLITEAENCRKSNYLTGASVCIRKAIYVLLENENSIVINQASKKANYADSIKALKKKFSYVTPDLFDTLGEIQELTSDVVHEGSWESWDSKHISLLIELLKVVLSEMYIIPEEKKRGVRIVSDIKRAIIEDKKTPKIIDEA